MTRRKHYVVWLKFSPSAAARCGELPNIWVEQGDGSMGLATANRIAKELGDIHRGIQTKVLPLLRYPMLLCIGDHEAKQVSTLDQASREWKAYRDANGVREDSPLRVLVRDNETRAPLAVITHNGRCWTPGSGPRDELRLAGVPTLKEEAEAAEEARHEEQQRIDWENA